MKKQLAGFARSTSQDLSKSRYNIWIKWAVIFVFHGVVFMLALWINGNPRPELANTHWGLLMQLVPPLEPIIAIIGTLAWILFNWQILRYLLILDLVAAIPFFFGALFVKQLYQVENFGIARSFFYEVTFLKPSDYLVGGKGSQTTGAAGAQAQGGFRFATIQDGKLVPRGKDKTKARNKTLAWMGGPGRVLVPLEYAIQSARAGELGRTFGPRLVQLFRYEKVYNIVDLRQAVRKDTVTALSRDGIPVEVEVTIHCRVRQKTDAPTKDKEKHPHLVDEDAVRTLTEKTMMLKEGRRPWPERAISFAGDIVNDVLANYRLDEIFEPLDPAADPRLAIQEEVKQIMTNSMDEIGIEVTEVWLGQFRLPENVTERYVDFWQAYHQQRDQQRLADGRAFTIREIGRARAQAQEQVINTLVASFKAARAADPSVPAKQLLAMRLIDSLEQLYRQAGRVEEADQQQILSTNQNLAKLRRLIQGTGSPTQE